MFFTALSSKRDDECTKMDMIQTCRRKKLKNYTWSQFFVLNVHCPTVTVFILCEEEIDQKPNLPLYSIEFQHHQLILSKWRFQPHFTALFAAVQSCRLVYESIQMYIAAISQQSVRHWFDWGLVTQKHYYYSKIKNFSIATLLKNKNKKKISKLKAQSKSIVMKKMSTIIFSPWQNNTKANQMKIQTRTCKYGYKKTPHINNNCNK